MQLMLAKPVSTEATNASTMRIIGGSERNEWPTEIALILRECLWDWLSVSHPRVCTNSAFQRRREADLCCTVPLHRHGDWLPSGAGFSSK